jgi:hypothetical protein
MGMIGGSTVAIAGGLATVIGTEIPMVGGANCMGTQAAAESRTNTVIRDFISALLTF